MLKFKDLSRAQKAFVLTAIAHEPALANAKEVTAQDVKRLYWEIKAKRETGGAVVAYPVWLSKHNSLSRGVQAWPAPTEDDLANHSKALADDARVERIKTERKVKAKEAKRVALANLQTSTKPKVKAEKKRVSEVIAENDGYEDVVSDYDFDAILKANGIYA